MEKYKFESNIKDLFQTINKNALSSMIMLYLVTSFSKGIIVSITQSFPKMFLIPIGVTMIGFAICLSLNTLCVNSEKITNFSFMLFIFVTNTRLLYLSFQATLNLNNPFLCLRYIYVMIECTTIYVGL